MIFCHHTFIGPKYIPLPPVNSLVIRSFKKFPAYRKEIQSDRQQYKQFREIDSNKEKDFD